MPRVQHRPFVAAALLALGAATATTPLGAQVLVVDQGTFSLFVQGQRVGREDFSIRETRGAARSTWVAQANILRGDTRHALVLTVDSAGSPLRFQRETLEGTVVVRSYAGERHGGIWSGRAVYPAGESARELRLPPDCFLTDGETIHQLWFVLRLGEGRPVTMLLPAGPTQQRAVLEEQAPDRVALGLREIVARRWVLRPPEGGSPLWELWTDVEGRLLRARHPASGLEALRDDPPGETVALPPA